jgi:hypothetical protein
MTLRWTKFIKGDNVPLYQPETMPSKDQQSIDEPSHYEKWDRAKSLMLESLHKPDNQLRSCGHNQQCYYELLEIRDQVINMVQNMRNPRPFVDERAQIPTLPKNPVATESFVESKSYEYAADVTLTDIAKFQRGSSL